jgi:hypothetical protein
MKGRPSVWRGTCARVVALGVLIALVPLPVAAAETHPSATPSIDLKAAVQKVAATERLASIPAAPARDRVQSGTAPNLESPSFFKTPLGWAVIAVVGAGSAYAIYSAQHDRIHSPGR